jgi:hypothetical protein
VQQPSRLVLQQTLSAGQQEAMEPAGQVTSPAAQVGGGVFFFFFFFFLAEA